MRPRPQHLLHISWISRFGSYDLQAIHQETIPAGISRSIRGGSWGSQSALETISFGNIFGARRTKWQCLRQGRNCRALEAGFKHCKTRCVLITVRRWWKSSGYCVALLQNMLRNLRMLPSKRFCGGKGVWKLWLDSRSWKLQCSFVVQSCFWEHPKIWLLTTIATSGSLVCHGAGKFSHFREIYIFNAGPFASRQRVSEYLTPELKW